jgi:hypothetical protein
MGLRVKGIMGCHKFWAHLSQVSWIGTMVKRLVVVVRKVVVRNHNVIENRLNC